jgi:hypothetical protein
MRRILLSLEESLEELLRPMFQIIELKIQELPQKLELVLHKDKNIRLSITMMRSKMVLTMYIIKIKIIRKMDTFIKKE